MKENSLPGLIYEIRPKFTPKKGRLMKVITEFPDTLLPAIPPGNYSVLIVLMQGRGLRYYLDSKEESRLKELRQLVRSGKKITITDSGIIY